MASEVYKIVNDIASDYIKDLINIKKSTYNFRRENQASLPAVKSTMYGLRSFRNEAAQIWNCLPNDLRLAESFPQFKRLLHAWDGDICGCPSCKIWALLCFCSYVLTPLHSLCLQAFAFRPLLFHFLSLCCKGCVSLGVCSLQSKCLIILNLINQNFSPDILQYPIVLVSSWFDDSPIPC